VTLKRLRLHINTRSCDDHLTDLHHRKIQSLEARVAVLEAHSVACQNVVRPIATKDGVEFNSWQTQHAYLLDATHTNHSMMAPGVPLRDTTNNMDDGFNRLVHGIFEDAGDEGVDSSFLGEASHEAINGTAENYFNFESEVPQDVVDTDIPSRDTTVLHSALDITSTSGAVTSSSTMPLPATSGPVPGLVALDITVLSAAKRLAVEVIEIAICYLTILAILVSPATFLDAPTQEPMDSFARISLCNIEITTPIRIPDESLRTRELASVWFRKWTKAYGFRSKNSRFAFISFFFITLVRLSSQCFCLRDGRWTSLLLKFHLLFLLFDISLGSSK
jgi:hypothetical protein